MWESEKIYNIVIDRFIMWESEKIYKHNCFYRKPGVLMG